MDLVIRRARRADKRGVLAAVRTIWGGSDRVPGLFDRWVTQRTGPFFVAIAGERLVGMGKLTVVSRTEAWLEGGRVAPRWRRRGVATALIAHRIAVAADRGFGILRFSTASDNTPIHRAGKRFGFRRVAAMARHSAKARAGAVPRRARFGELAATRRVLGPLVQFASGWEWRSLTGADVRAAIRAGRAFVAGASGIGAAAIIGRRRDGALPVVALGGRGKDLGELMLGLRAEAARRELDEVSVYLARAPERRAAARAGYRRPVPWDAYLYEKRLKRRAGSKPSPARR